MQIFFKQSTTEITNMQTKNKLLIKKYSLLPITLTYNHEDTIFNSKRKIKKNLFFNFYFKNVSKKLTIAFDFFKLKLLTQNR